MLDRIIYALGVWTLASFVVGALFCLLRKRTIIDWKEAQRRSPELLSRAELIRYGQSQ